MTVLCNGYIQRKGISIIRRSVFKHLYVCTFVPSGFAGAHKPKNHFSYGLIDLARYQSQRFACDFVSTAATSAFYSSGLKTFSFYRACVPGETTVNSI